MTVEEILRDLEENYSDMWPRAAIVRLMNLWHQLQSLYNLEDADEFNLLLEWTVETVEAGIAFRQGSLIEH
jgi:hypothetical protein